MRSFDLYHNSEKWAGHTPFTGYIFETQATQRSTAEKKKKNLHMTGPGINLVCTLFWEGGAFQTFSKP